MSPRLPWLDDLVTNCVANQVRNRLQAQLANDCGPVSFYRFYAYPETGSDFPIGFPVGKQANDVALLCRLRLAACP